jgi:hypothetical protein
MRPSRLPARLAALATAVALIVSCDSRNTIAGPETGTGTTPVPTNDNTAPTLKIALATGSGTADTIVYIGGNLGVTITSTDAVGVSTLSTVLRTPAGAGIVDSITYVPTVLSATRAYTINVTSIAKGDRLVFTTTARDASANTKIDSLRVTVADTATPVVTVASKIGASVKGLDSVDVAILATDAAGIDSAGVRLVYVRGVGDTVVVFSRSAKPAVRTTSYSLDLGFRISDTLPIGQYLLQPFAADKSGLVARNPTPFSFSLTDATRPQITILEPVAGQKVGVGDTAGIFVKVRLTDNAGVASLRLSGYSQRGDSLLGTNHTDQRYTAIVAPASGSFPQTRDTTITRKIYPIVPVDSTADTLWVSATVTDVSGLTTTVRVAVQMTNGPKVTLEQPKAGDSLTKGDLLTIRVSAISSVGVKTLGFALSDSGFPTSVAQVPDSVLGNPSAPNQTVSYTATVLIPANAAGVLTITPHATDVNNQPGAAVAFRIAVRQGAPPVPLVRQTINARVELVDSVTISATGSGLKNVGYTIHDLATDALVDSAQVAASASSFGPRAIAFRISPEFQGAKIRITSFAIDAQGKVGYSVPAAVNTPQTSATLARYDTTLVVYGQSFPLPRNGVAGDLSVDSIRGNVFVSNTKYNRLERWNAAAAKASPATAFDAVGVAVGSEPWGMTVQLDNDTLLVANSGGTNISKVCIAAACGGIKEIASARLQTRNTYVYTVTEVTDPASLRVHLTATGPIGYSDRPQYVQQSAAGRLYYSTKPTAFAPEGSIRYIDPRVKVPDPRQVYQYAVSNSGTTTNQRTYVLFNTDSIKIQTFEGANPPSDSLIIYDHVYGDTLNTPGVFCNGSKYVICGKHAYVETAIAMVNAQQGDVIGRLDVDVNKLGLTDTTFVAASGDHNWIGFGEGNTSGRTGRVMMVKDTANTQRDSIYFSPGVTVTDLLQNASESVFGMSLDRHGANVAVHGTKTYFASLEAPFHLRLQGEYDSFDRGAGVVYHPSADLRNGFFGSSPSDSTRTAYVASSNGSIEIVDAFNFVSRGSLQIKGTLYGPLRASLPFATDNVGIPANDPRFIVLKLFGLTSNGLVVIDLRAKDIKPVP